MARRSLYPPGMRTRALCLLAPALALLAPAAALARPEGPSILCESYPDAPACRGRVAECSTCHVSTWPVAWNDFGDQVAAWMQGSFTEDLPATLAHIDAMDADGDGVSNGDEILLGTNPGDADSVWAYCAAPAPSGDVPVPDGYDFDRALRRVTVLYCGRSPTYEERAAFDADGAAPGDLYLRLHDALGQCLDSTYWRDEGLARLADPRVRPIEAVGIRSPVGIVIGDFDWDYTLFSYVLTGDRDARDLLLARYHVEREADGTLVRRDGTFDSPRGAGAGGQPLDPAQRAGMLTTQWFLSINTMFSPLPRTTAAQAYRAYLGADIAQQQGIFPIAGEPLDVDEKGVRDARCATCHSTLDPLSYAFAEYEGIRGDRTGVFDATRPARVIDGWRDPQSYLLGEPIGSVREWAEVAADSDEFLRNLAMMFFEHAFERAPTPAEETELVAAWAAMREDGYSANGLIHRLVDLGAWGGVQ